MNMSVPQKEYKGDILLKENKYQPTRLGKDVYLACFLVV